ncbi:hypothetical protein LNO75_00555 [Mycoplasma sp. T363T]|uniref:Uncharacterized protein n=1 Tax=Mycoplasma bradburyae TaxID=2963128 RepID=A0AAW6HNW8_9MOLU|nr:hypothetical protein [Mycoplasma bradburyae]MDC4163072.1 hypothetical protein [Mycoplasma bradburyae]MDC4181663.1 hypothetical protein [Mycoplasma bradburyae]MDC4182390.1 hypothetical protein [Mycoplasma bradburyae]MDC4183117.1 hypothetical protein [Mycoplasma bradburyae]UTS69915.1 hypothetical protein NMG68_02725 [Mycoplasma bradburyae]
MLKILSINQIDHKIINKIKALIFDKFNLNKNIIPFLLKQKVEKLFISWALMRATKIIIDEQSNSYLIYSDNSENINKKYQQDYIETMNTFENLDNDENKGSLKSIIQRFKNLLLKYETLILNDEVQNDIRGFDQILLLLANDNKFLSNAKALIDNNKELFGFSASHINYSDYEDNGMYQIIKTPFVVNNIQIKDFNTKDVEIFLYSSKQAID